MAWSANDPPPGSEDLTEHRVTTAEVVYNAQVAIREAIVEYASAAGTIDPAAFHVANWRLTRDGVPVF